jgi:hypothetical protein
MTTDDGYADWLRSNPAPDLQVLVGCHGGYDKITPGAWAEYDRAMADSHERRRNRSAGVQSSEIPNSDRADPEALCVCGLRGLYMWPLCERPSEETAMTEILVITTAGTATLALIIAAVSVLGWLWRYRR